MDLSDNNYEHICNKIFNLVKLPNNNSTIPNRQIIFCNICQDDINDNKKYIYFDCGHYFHTRCLQEYYCFLINHPTNWGYFIENSEVFIMNKPFSYYVENLNKLDTLSCPISKLKLNYKPEILKMIKLPLNVGYIRKGPSFRKKDLEYLKQFCTFGDIIDLYGYRYTDVRILNENNEWEKCKTDNSTYGYIPYKYTNKRGYLFYYNHYNKPTWMSFKNNKDFFDTDDFEIFENMEEFESDNTCNTSRIGDIIIKNNIPYILDNTNEYIKLNNINYKYIIPEKYKKYKSFAYYNNNTFKNLAIKVNDNEYFDFKNNTFFYYTENIIYI